jgi:protein O-mannosyl-transferase
VLKPSIKIVLLTLVIFIAFSPSLFAEICAVDDLDVYKWLSGSDLTFKGLFFPQSSGGFYYRPLIGVSYLFDQKIWFLDTRLMHLDNIVFHLFNSLLVYYLASLIISRKDHRESLIPFFAALIFGVHPVVVESVAWISGRTDVMACTFVLLSTVSLLKYRETRNYWYLILAPFLLVPGVLFKETPLAFIIGALFILDARYDESGLNCGSEVKVCRGFAICALFAGISAVLMLVTYNVWLVLLLAVAYICQESFSVHREGRPIRKKYALLVVIATVLAGWIFFILRSIVFTSSVSSVSRTIKLIVDDLNYAFQTFLGASGFYVKKFFFPFPLNFAIREVDPLYNIAGVGILFLCLYLIRQRNVVDALFLSGICLFLPALPLSLGTVTWTAYAERYMYMSTAFWTIAVSVWIWRYVIERGFERRSAFCATLLLIAMGAVTFQRSFTWRTNEALLCDTVKKSPAFRLVREAYMVALMGSGKLKEAKNEYLIASAIHTIGYKEALDINMAAIHVMEGRYDEASRLYEHIIQKTDGKSEVAYGAYIQFLNGLYATALKENKGSAPALGSKLIDNMGKLYKLNKDPMLLYRSGQLCLAMGRGEEALRLFRESKKKFSDMSEYARFASRLVSSLEEGRCRQEGI